MPSIFDKLETYLSNNNSAKVHDELNFIKNNLGGQGNKSKKHKISSVFTKWSEYLQSKNEYINMWDDLKYIKSKLEEHDKLHKEHDEKFKEQQDQNKKFDKLHKEHDDKFKEHSKQLKELNNRISEIKLTDYHANRFTQFAMSIINDSSDE